MTSTNKIKLEKYIPVRKQLKAINDASICQKQPLVDDKSCEKPLLQEAA